MTLLRYTVNRLLQAIPVLIGITLITFLLANALPGDPVDIMTQGQEVTEQQLETLEQQYGLDRPIHERYLSYMWGAVQGDFGHSFHRDIPVSELLWQRIPPTLMLILSAFAFAMVTAIPLGVIAAHRRNKPTDHVSRIVALVGVSTPSFWIGILLIIIFAVRFGWLPAGRLVYPWRAPGHYDYASHLQLYIETVRHLLLPMVALGTLQMATIMRIERSSMVENLQKEYVQLARAYGVPERKILRKHAFRAAQLPVITIVGLNLSSALGGAVLTETVFEINGMGRLLIDAIQQLDYQVVMGVTIIFASSFLIGVIVTDISYAYVDPRVSYGEGE